MIPSVLKHVRIILKTEIPAILYWQPILGILRVLEILRLREIWVSKITTFERVLA